MVDVVRLAAAVVQANDFANDGDQVIGRKDALFRGIRPAEALVDLVAADLAEVIAARVEEQRADKPAGVVDGGRVPRPEPPVELQQSLFLVCGARIAVQRGLDKAMVGVGVDVCEERQDTVAGAQDLEKLVPQLVRLALGLGVRDLLLDLLDFG